MPTGAVKLTHEMYPVTLVFASFLVFLAGKGRKNLQVKDNCILINDAKIKWLVGVILITLFPTYFTACIVDY